MDTSEVRAYSFEEHLERFAMWTSARAAQRAFTNTKNIVDALKAVELPQKIRNLRRFFRRWAHHL